MRPDDEPFIPDDTKQIDNWIELMLHSSPAQSDNPRGLPDPHLLQELQALCHEQAQTVNDRVERVWHRLEGRAGLSQGQRQELVPVRPAFLQERVSSMQKPTLLVRAARRWPTRLSALAAAVLLVVLVGGLITGLILVHHSSSPTGHPGATATRAATPPVTPTPEGSNVPDLLNLTMLDAQHGWALNVPEHVTQTPDGGITFSSTNQYQILSTSDGGNHWQDVTPARPQGTIIVPDFVTAQLSWLFVGPNLLYVTTNGGQTWQQKGALPEGQYNQLSQVFFLDAEHGWLILADPFQQGSIALFRTTDGGRSWMKLQNTDAQGNSQPDHLPLRHFPQLTFLDASTGWASVESARTDGVVQLYVTHDGGATWQQQTVQLPTQGFSGPTVGPKAPEFFNPQDGILDVASSSAVFQPLAADLPQSEVLGRVIYMTHDGGATWQHGALLPDPLGSVSFSDANHGWVASSSNLDLWATSDGGGHWTKLPSRGPSPYAGGGSTAYSAIDFVSSQVGWAERDDTMNGTRLFKTVDGGRTWTQITLIISH